MSLKRRYMLRRKELKQLAREVGEKFGENITKLVDEGAEILKLESGREVVLAGDRAILFRTPEGLFPVLTAADLIPLRRVVVDMGAVPHVANGADIMGPGVVSAEQDIKTGETVIVTDERHGKPLAIGLALRPGSEMKARGKVVKNLHHVGDEVWRMLRKG
ncbi:MAG: RNA-binding protein [Candidatus Hodarchaeaceae archaeon]|nr:RNA-binding protein [Candidatus Hodarchaeaceae archaeon]